MIQSPTLLKNSCKAPTSALQIYIFRLSWVVQQVHLLLFGNMQRGRGRGV